MRVAIILLLLFAVTGVASAAVGTGLEVPSGTKLNVLVEKQPFTERNIDPTEKLLATEVERVLRGKGILVGTVVDSAKEFPISDAYLYVRVAVSEVAWAIKLDFKRTVFYRVGDDTQVVVASTYDRGGLGTRDPQDLNMLNALVKHANEFATDFLKANRH